ncbi:SGNH/GDSL hydrolase family protein [Sphingomonas sp. Mn802worker]|uniref:SGNH/GDSL hydrolase family protein n=1 Tax=Sphingomonas sp. Mn802worker TaxID=629773 RepID=UPI0003601B02|nr:SGNH/GDSL hydrolase family protein [Sphingomonas sp. Mn802worker]
MASAQTGGHWVRAWTASPLPSPPDKIVTIENATLRATVRVGAAGSSLRLRLSNEHGSEVVRIDAATIRGPDGAFVPVTFAGKREARIEIGAPLVSDPVRLPVKAFELVDVSLFVKNRTALTTAHQAGGTPTLISQAGDFTRAARFTEAQRSTFRPLIAGLDVQSARPRPIIVAYGDSITDNNDCANDAPLICRWGDALGRRFAAAGRPEVVITQAIGGNRLLAPGAGPSALMRFDRDVLSVPGVTHVAILEGINDIGTIALAKPSEPLVTAEQLIGAFRQLIVRAHEHGIKVVGFTILPYRCSGRYTEASEAVRVAVNRWIMTGGAFDAIFDLEKTVADPADPKRLARALQFGDDLHPNDAGETKMAEAIPLSLFR